MDKVPPGDVPVHAQLAVRFLQIVYTFAWPNTHHYGYCVTDSYPWVPGCLSGTPHASFNKNWPTDLPGSGLSQHLA